MSQQMRNQRGYTLVELMIVLTIIGIVGFIIIGVGYFGLYRGGTYVMSLSVEDTDVISVVEEAGYSDVRVIEVFRLDPEDVGCAPADDAGFNISTSAGDVTMCCIGDWGSQPRCTPAGQ